MKHLREMMSCRETGNRVPRPGEVAATMHTNERSGPEVAPFANEYVLSLQLRTLFTARTGDDRSMREEAERVMVRELYRDLLTHTSRIRSAALTEDWRSVVELVQRLEDEYLT